MKSRTSLCGGLLVIAASSPALSQCPLEAAPGIGIPGTDGVVVAIHEWDPDGNGPTPPWTVLGGSFTFAGDRNAPGLIAFEEATGTWHTLATSIDGQVGCLATLASGELVVGGWFQQIDGVSCGLVAKFDGTSWSTIGGGLSGPSWAGCNDLLRLASGDLVATGGFDHAGGQPAQCIAQWNGTTWQPLGSGLTNQYGQALTELPNGDVIVGGDFELAGSVLANGLARWNGSNWSTVGNGSDRVEGWVLDLGILANGDLVAAGSIGHAGNQSSDNLYVWDGTTWSSLGLVDGLVDALWTDANGDLVIGGEFTVLDNVQRSRIARWNGSVWLSYGLGIDYSVAELHRASSGSLYAGGLFTKADTQPAMSIARYDNFQWRALHGGLDWQVDELVLARDGSILAGGPFRSADGFVTAGLARYSNGGWHAIGNLQIQDVKALLQRATGEIVAFGTAGLHQWNGATWTGLGVYHGVRAMAELPTGELVVGGSIWPVPPQVGWGIQVLGSNGWQPLGSGVLGEILDIVVMPNGDIVVGGHLTHAGGQPVSGVARWNGSAWSAVGSGLPQTNDLLVTAAGELFAAGPTHVARWDGASWQQLPMLTGQVRQLLETPAGDLLACGSFAIVGNQPEGRVMRWDGTSWTETVHLPSSSPSYVTSMTFDANGDLMLGGNFLNIDSKPSPFFGRVASTCPATSASYGSGCASSVGPVTLETTALPWLGATFRSQAAGVPANAAAVIVHGVAPTQVALPTLLPFAPAGCELLVAPALVDLVLPNGQGIEVAFAVPVASALIGAVLHEQVLPFEFGIDELTASNALELTFGTF